MDLEKKIRFLWILLMIGLQQYATFYASGITNDSEQYLSAAQSFSEKGIFLDKDGNYYGAHTPLYPVMLSIGIDHVLRWASVLNMISLVAALWVMFSLGERLIHHSISRGLYQGSLALGTPILLVGNFVWSEPLFLLFLSVIWYGLYSYYQRPSHHYLIGLILVTNLLCLQRNAGIFFFFVVLFVIFLRQQKWHALLYGALGAVGFIGWNMYVYNITSGSQNIAEQAYFFSFMSDFLENFPTLAAWFFPGKWQVPLFITLVSGVSLFIYRLYKKKEWDLLHIQIIGFIACMCLIYFAFIAAMWWKLEQWDVERYLSVLYPLVMLAAFMVWDKVFTEIAGKRVKLFLVVLSFLWLCYPIARTVKNVVFWHEVNEAKKEMISYLRWKFYGDRNNDSINAVPCGKIIEPQRTQERREERNG